MQLKQVLNTSNKINFCYNLTNTENIKSNIGVLIHQTSMFREPQTDEFVINHIKNNLKSKDSISLVSAACSSGEEAFSYLVMLDSLLKKLQISAFDIDENCISNARTGKVFISADISEAFLLDSKAIKTDFQRVCHDKFKKYFKPTGRATMPKNNFFTKFLKLISSSKYRAKFMFEFEIDPEIFKHIAFLKGDIEKIQDMYEPESVDILLCRNAMYHILCETRAAGDYRTERANSYYIAENIAKQMNKIMKTGGMVVFGEEEEDEGVRNETIADVMYHCGFRPVYIKDSKQGDFFTNCSDNASSTFYSNIWEKVENID